MRDLIPNEVLLHDIKELIERAKKDVAVSVNSTLTLLYWYIGHKINTDIVQNKRATYGKEIVATLSQQLQREYGKGYSRSSLSRMMKFADLFEEQNIATLSQQLSWSHFRELITLDDEMKIGFYIQMSMMDKWSVRVLKERIDSMLYERTALSKKPDDLIKMELNKLHHGIVSTDVVLKDPYILDFLDLDDRYLEKDLEDAILRDIEHFILELGVGFTFVARQKRIVIDNEDFKIDLLFYNRKLKRLIAIELKLGKFKAAYKGQTELYLKWLDKHEREEGELPPIGIILCADKKSEQIELLELDKSNIHVAQYLTVLPQRDKLEAKLHQALIDAKERYDVKD